MRPCSIAPQHAPEFLDRLVHCAVPRMPCIQPQIIPELMSGGKYRARRDRDAKVECASMHVERIHRGCAFDPEKVAAARRGNAITCRKMPSQGGQRGVL